MDSSKQSYPCIFATQNGRCMRAEVEKRSAVRRLWMLVAGLAVCTVIDIITVGLLILLVMQGR